MGVKSSSSSQDAGSPPKFTSAVDAVNDAFLNAMTPRYIVYAKPASPQLLLHFQENPFEPEVGGGWSLVPAKDMLHLTERLKTAQLKIQWEHDIGGNVLCELLGEASGLGFGIPPDETASVE